MKKFYIITTTFIFIALIILMILSSCSKPDAKYAYIAYYDAVEAVLDDCCKVYDFMDTTAEGDEYQDYSEARYNLEYYFFGSSAAKQEKLLKQYYIKSELLIRRIHKDVTKEELDKIREFKDYSDYIELKHLIAKYSRS